MSDQKTQQFLVVQKEAYKFSAAHMTVFSSGHKEKLHGHNFEVELKIELKSSEMIPFMKIKEIMKAISNRWDEKVLLAKKNPHFKITAQNNIEIDFLLCEDRYVLPLRDVELLDCDNITTENLSRLYAQSFLDLIENSLLEKIRTLQVTIFEYNIQGASHIKIL
jgi:6-pyruvoyltetrahydropterin/6-carboxytetrahydropterin synthase